MSDIWDFYFSRVNDVPSSIAVNLSIRADAPDPTRAQLLWVWVPMRSPRPDGLSSSDEAPALGRIEDALSRTLCSTLDALCVGRITGDSRREFYFYAARQGPLDALVADVLKTEPGYSAECGQQHDPEWSQYLDLLYPTPLQQEQMQNRRVIEALAARGDRSEAERSIQHWAYFATASSRDEAIVRLQRAGFTVGEQNADVATEPRPYGLQFRHHGPATRSSVDDASFRILEALSGLDGEYDGWESPVVEAPAAPGFWSRLFSRGT